MFIKKDIEHFPCHSCGSDLHFNPTTQDMLCPHCGAQEKIPSLSWEDRFAVAEIYFDEVQQDMLTPEPDMEVEVAECSNCGAELRFHNNLSATSCPYCASPISKINRATTCLKPRAVVPFAVSQNEAQAIIQHWISTRPFAPNALKSFAKHMEGIVGIYAPFWTFDANTQTRYEGERGDSGTIGAPENTGRIMKISFDDLSWYKVSGNVMRFFNDTLSLASHHLPQSLMINVRSWDMSGLRAYNSAYMAGFISELYSIGLVEGFHNAKDIMDRKIENDIKRDIGGQKQKISWKSTLYTQVTYKHILLPVWVAAYTHRGKTYEIVINGQTGSIVGERPYSIVKLGVAALIATSLLAGLIYIGYQNGMFAPFKVFIDAIKLL